MTLTAPGFHLVVPAGGGKDAVLRWLAELATAPAGAQFEVGLTWDPENKWRVYQRIGDKALMLGSEQARKLHRGYEKMRKRPEWRGVSDGLIDSLGVLGELASEAYHKNQAGIVPEGGIGFMPAKGRA